MARKYDSSRRRETAAETRRRILQAALKLHWEGITEFAALAEEAGCSEATVRKHFPTKESLFRSCTNAFAETLDPPDLEAIAAVDDSDQRVQMAVSELCRIHEAMLGYAWLGSRQRDDSAVLDAEMLAYEGLADAIAEMVAPDIHHAVVRSLLHFLTYRAFRLSGNLSPEAARSELIQLVRTVLVRPTQTQERPKP